MPGGSPGAELTAGTGESGPKGNHDPALCSVSWPLFWVSWGSYATQVVVFCGGSSGNLSPKAFKGHGFRELVTSQSPNGWCLESTEYSLLGCCCVVVKSCLTLCDPMDCSLPQSSVHGILQARILEWVAISSSRGSSRPRRPGSRILG